MGQELRAGFAALGLVLIGGAPAIAFDCAKARQPIEKAICADPAAKAADDAMDAAFTALRAAVPEEQRKAALANQRDWLKERNQKCTGDKAAACIAEADKERLGLLTGRPESGPGPSKPLLPYFVAQAGSRDKVEVDVQLYKFADPSTPGERLLNARADEITAKIDFKKDEPDDRSWSHEESWSISYASPDFISIWSTGYDYSGGAHGGASGSGIHVDLRSGRIVGFSDLFDAKARAEINKSCLKKVKAEKTERGAGDDADDPDLAKKVSEVVKDLANWSINEKQASVYFGQYSIGSYAEGVYGCDLPIDELNKLSKVPLPPR